jgi:predicted nucleotidyltransferase
MDSETSFLNMQKIELEQALSVLAENKRTIIIQMIKDLAHIPGVQAIALGGSYARGTARQDSDVDLGLYYSENSPFSIDSIKALAKKYSSTPDYVVTELYEWGPWVNGGAWLNTSVGEVDWLYRNLDQVNKVVANAKQGHFSWDFRQQPPYGFFSVMYLADLQHNIPLYDPKGIFIRLKEETQEYPEALRQVIIQEHLWSIEFSYFNAKKLANSGCIYGTVGCMSRIVAELTQVLFALNRVYFITEKGALEVIDKFSIKPTEYATRINDILSAPGKGKLLVESLKKLYAIIQEVIKLSGSLYTPKYTMES